MNKKKDFIAKLESMSNLDLIIDGIKSTKKQLMLNRFSSSGQSNVGFSCRALRKQVSRSIDFIKKMSKNNI